jgi:hypothetical protein
MLLLAVGSGGHARNIFEIKLPHQQRIRPHHGVMLTAAWRGCEVCTVSPPRLLNDFYPRTL